MGFIVKSIIFFLQIPTVFPLSIYGSPLNGLESRFSINGLGGQTVENAQKYPIPFRQMAFPKTETSFNPNPTPIRIGTYPIETANPIESSISKSDLENSILESFISETDLENSIFQNSIFRQPRNLQKLYEKRPEFVDRLRYFLETMKNTPSTDLKLNPNYEPENIIKHEFESRASKTGGENGIIRRDVPNQMQMAEIRCYDTKMGAFLGPMFCSPKHLIAA